MKDRIKQILDAFGMRQKDMAERLGVGNNVVNRWVKGTAEPSAPARASICATFGIRREWLETGTGEMRAEASERSLASASIDELQKAYVKKLVESLPLEVQTRVVSVVQDFLDARKTRERDERRQAELEEMQARLEEERAALREAERKALLAADKERRSYWERRHEQGINGTKKGKDVPTNTFEKVEVVNVDQRTNASDDGLDRLLAIQRERRKAFGLDKEDE